MSLRIALLASVAAWFVAFGGVFYAFAYRDLVSDARRAFYLGCTIGSLAQDKKVTQAKCQAAADSYVGEAFRGGK